MKKRENYVITRSTPTLAKSGLLAVLQQRQRDRVFQLARRDAQRKQARAAFLSAFNWLSGHAPSAVAGRPFRREFEGSLPRHT